MATRMSMKEHARVSIPADTRWLSGQFGSPSRPRGLVLLAHDTDSDRDDWTAMATVLEGRGFATLSIALLTPDDAAIEVGMRRSHFAVTMLVLRFLAVIDWVKARPETARLPIGVLGAGVGGAAALTAAALRPRQIGAVISCSAPLDLVGPTLPDVGAPTLLIVGGLDTAAITLNREAMARMSGGVVLDLIPGVCSLDGAATVRTIMQLAAEWFGRHLVREPLRPYVF